MSDTTMDGRARGWPNIDAADASRRSLLACGVSLGIFLFAMESERLPALIHVDDRGGVPLVRTLIAFAILLAFTVFRTHRPARRPAPLVIVALTALACSLSLAIIFYLKEGAPLPAVETLGGVLYSVTPPLLLYFWVERAAQFGRPFALQGFGTGAITVGCLVILTMAFEQTVAVALVVALPLVGVAVLSLVDGDGAYTGRDFSADGSPWGVLKAVANASTHVLPENRGDSKAGGLDAGARAFAGRGDGPGARGASGAALRLLLKLVPFFCYAVIFGNVHFSWLELQGDASVGMWVQAGAAVGAMACGLTAFGLEHVHWGRALESILHLLLALFALVALWLSTFLTSGYVFAYLVLLNIAQKLAVMLMLLFGFPFARDGRECAALWTLAYFAFYVGTCVSYLVGTLKIASLLNIVAALALAVVFAADIANIFMLYGGRPEEVGASNAAGATGTGAARAAITAGAVAAAEAADTVRAAGDACDLQVPTGERPAIAIGIEATETTPAPAASALIDTTSIAGAPTPQAKDDTETPQDIPGFDALDYTCHLLAARHDLTRREEEVLQLLARGRSASRVAETLGISTATTRTHFRNIYAKLGVHSQQDILDLFEQC